jgi:hypothetical protein
MEIEKLKAIESLGHLLAFYKSDLEYITNFKLFKNRTISEEYLKKNSGFQAYINEFGIARNIRKEKVKDLMFFIRNSKLIENDSAVDTFTEEMKNNKLTHKNKAMTVLASKIFFLNQPGKIIPMDRYNKTALGLSGNKYKDFKIKIDGFINENKKIISSHINSIVDSLVAIEKSVNLKIDFKKYRINRFADKYLWVEGKKLNKAANR